MCSNSQYKCFEISGVVTYLATLTGAVLMVLHIVEGIMQGLGAWPIVGMILATIILLIIGCGLGFLFQAVAYFIKRFSNYKCVYPETTSKKK